MYDPSTVAFDIKYPWRSGPKTKFSPKGWRATFITIWHEDPQIGGRGNRTDDSCGWFTPPSTKADREKFRKIGEGQYGDIFRQREVLAKGDPERYAYVCYEPSDYDAVYWAWRRIKREYTGHRWQYGREKNYLTRGELEAIYGLASSPIDNLRASIESVKNAETCGDFFMLVWNAYRRFHRPWFKHPRWHVWHWRIQIHPYQRLRRWLLSRCAKCGGRFAYGESPTSHGYGRERPKFLRGEVGVYHSDCSGVCVGPAPAEVKP